MRSLQLQLNSAGRLLHDSDTMSWDAFCRTDLQWWSVESHLLVGFPLGLSHPRLSLFTDASDSGWGASLDEDRLSGSWSRSCSQFSINHRELLVVLYGVQGFLPLLRDQSVSLFVDTTTTLAYLRNRGHSLVPVELSGSGHFMSLRGSQDSFGSPVHSQSYECSGGLPQSPVAGPEIGENPLLSCFPRSSLSLAGNHRPFCDGSEPSAPGVLLTDGRSAVSGHGCYDAVVGRSAGLRLPSLRSAPACSREGQAIQGSGANLDGSVLASTPLVSRPSGASGGSPGVPSTSEGSTQTASLPWFPPELPCASSDCVSYLERSARAFGFTSAVARQLARCRCSSTRVNY